MISSELIAEWHAFRTKVLRKIESPPLDDEVLCGIWLAGVKAGYGLNRKEDYPALVSGDFCAAVRELYNT